MAMPPRVAKRWSEAEVCPATQAAYEALLDRLLGLGFNKGPEGEPAPHVLPLDEGAKTIWVRFYDEWAREQAEAEGELASAFSKLEAYAARFALLHHVVTRAARGEDDLGLVGEESVLAGVALCRWFAREARRVYAILSESAEERDARRLVEFIRSRGGSITIRGLQRANDRKYPTSAHAEAALESLVHAGLAQWQGRPGTPKGGNPARVAKLTPAPDSSDGCPTSCSPGPADGAASSSPHKDHKGANPLPTRGKVVEEVSGGVPVETAKGSVGQVSEVSGVKCSATSGQELFGPDGTSGNQEPIPALGREPAGSEASDPAP
jgi:hypothetical protein